MQGELWDGVKQRQWVMGYDNEDIFGRRRDERMWYNGNFICVSSCVGSGVNYFVVIDFSLCFSKVCTESF